MGSTICVLVMPEPGTEEGVALIFQRIYPEKQDVVQFESEDEKVLLVCTADLAVKLRDGAAVGHIRTLGLSTPTDASLVFVPTDAYAKVGLTALEARVQHVESFLEFERQLFRHYSKWATSPWLR